MQNGGGGCSVWRRLLPPASLIAALPGGPSDIRLQAVEAKVQNFLTIYSDAKGF